MQIGRLPGAAGGAGRSFRGRKPGPLLAWPVGQTPPGDSLRVHHFSVDVEEYFQVSALEAAVPRAQWPSRESRVARSVDLLLELLERHDSRATFFVLGWVAERDAQLVRRIAASGHEIASHGWDHRRVREQGPAAFRTSVRRTRQYLEDITGTAVLGFRAPSFSIVRGCEWALDVLIEEGYRYDSSLFPIRRPGYGYADGLRDPHWIDRPGGRLAEAPPATVSLLGLRLPAGGGAYFRLLPYALVRSAFREAERRGAPSTFYIHPWELDPDQPRVDVSLATRIRHYGGLAGTRPRLERLLTEFRFRPIADTVNAL
jgi:polysaccharide deacetylase family protein (PEP-CTERM system associated)